MTWLVIFTVVASSDNHLSIPVFSLQVAGYLICCLVASYLAFPTNNSTVDWTKIKLPFNQMRQLNLPNNFHRHREHYDRPIGSDIFGGPYNSLSIYPWPSIQLYDVGDQFPPNPSFNYYGNRISMSTVEIYIFIHNPFTTQHNHFHPNSTLPSPFQIVTRMTTRKGRKFCGPWPIQDSFLCERIKLASWE